MEHVQDHAGGEGARGVALMRRNMKHLPRLQAMGDAIDRELEGAAQQQGPLLVQMGVIGDDGARCDVDPALSDVVRVDVTPEVAGNDLTRRNGGEVEQPHESSPLQGFIVLRSAPSNETSPTS